MHQKKLFLLFFAANILFAAQLFCDSAVTPEFASAGIPRPSVEDVFAGMSPDEIAKQVETAQMLIEDLHKHGSEEEVKAFYEMLETTINSMTPKDIEDITNIAKMVESLITIPEQPMPTPSESASSSSISSTIDTTPSVSVDVVETFKNMISSIIDHIDSIFQKISSSKECSELVDTQWDNKATFNNMKRQIAQLKHDRLAKKLTAPSLSDDEKSLVKKLEQFKDVVKKYDNLIKISDDFGLQSTNPKKELKDIQAFLDAANDTIDTLMPSIEKFLQKYDPEALQMAKEAEALTKKATKDAVDATIRKASPDAKPISSSATGYNKSYTSPNYYDQDYGYAPEYYDENDMYGLQQPQDFQEATSKSASGSSGSDSTKKAEQAKTNEKESAKENRSSDSSSKIKGDLAEFIEDEFPKTYETDYVKFINDSATAYPIASNELTNGGTISNTNPADEKDWVDSVNAYAQNGFKQYTQKILNDLSNKFDSEFSSLYKIISDARNDIYKLSDEHIKDLQNNKYLTAISNRLNTYKSAYKTTLSKIDAAFQKNAPATQAAGAKNMNPNTPNSVAYYQQKHQDFVDALEQKIGKKIDDLETNLKGLKGKLSRAAKSKK
ncbi:hypothetical protein KAZ82_01720 [Candidatus Babeliales bacterium]|nr:hypothetical protein [Candidatus Babeliales bacterium]